MTRPLKPNVSPTPSSFRERTPQKTHHPDPGKPAAFAEITQPAFPVITGANGHPRHRFVPTPTAAPTSSRRLRRDETQTPRRLETDIPKDSCTSSSSRTIPAISAQADAATSRTPWSAELVSGLPHGCRCRLRALFSWSLFTLRSVSTRLFPVRINYKSDCWCWEKRERGGLPNRIDAIFL